MSEELTKVVSGLYGELKKVEERAAEIKKMINSTCALMGKPQPFSEVELSSVSSGVNVHPDQFFGKGLSTAVKEYLRMRGRAATAREIFDGLKAGGFEFPKGKAEQIQFRNLTISLSKNTTDFVYVKSSNAYGLWDFYPEKKKEKKKSQKTEEKEESHKGGALGAERPEERDGKQK